MKITNTKTGKAYQLAPGTQIEIERPNLFFNEWGEQTTPIELPDTDVNRELCEYPDLLGNVQRPRADIECTVQDGNFCQTARQAVLGARRKEGITTTLYMNEGSFLSKVDETSVSDVFGDETIPGISTIEEGIEFCRKLAKNTSDYGHQFAIFPVLLEEGTTSEKGNTVYRYLNRYGKFDTKGYWQDSFYQDEDDLDFYNAVDRAEKSGEDTIQVPAGFYLSPYLKANYLLERILEYFGYQLQDSFFSLTAPFTDMVFVNNCCDSLVNGRIRLSDLVPDCTCGDILNVFRKKFCCEIVTDEAKRTATLVLMNDVLATSSTVDLTPYLVGYPSLEAPESYKRITLQSESSSESEIENPETLGIMLSNYKYLFYDVLRNAYYRHAVKMTNQGTGVYFPSYLTEYVSDGTQAYNAGDSLEEESVQVPDKQLCFRTAEKDDTVEPPTSSSFSALYIGGGKFLNSNLLPATGKAVEGETEEMDSENEETNPMLAFVYHKYGYAHGTIGTTALTLDGTEKLWDYALSYVGPSGIFEKFYRKMDELHRNSLLSVKANLLLPDTLKQSLSSYLPVTLQGQTLLPNIIHFAIGGNTEPVESEFYTSRLYNPIEYAPSAELYGKNSDELSTYHWVARQERTEITQQQYEASSLRDRWELVLYPDYPSEKYADGQRHFQQSADVWDDFAGKRTYYHFDIWLECWKDDS